MMFVEVHICVAQALKSHWLKNKPFAFLRWHSFMVIMVLVGDWQTNLWKKKQVFRQVFRYVSILQGSDYHQFKA